jgi:ABC-2 type transport system ATP-binding protein
MSDSEPPALPAIEVSDLTYRYRKTLALNSASFRVEEGRIHGFVGPNGAGKTTALRILATLLRHRNGTVRIFGHDVIADRKKVRQQIGFMPDHFSMYRQMTVFEYLDFFGAAYGLPLAKRNGVIDDVLALTDMDGRRNDVIKTLSRGMQQRISLARVLVHDPRLLLLDEPASGLDPRARIELMEILRELQRMGKTIFISSHILSELAELCDSVTIIDRGSVKYSGTIHDLSSEDTSKGRYVFTLDDHHGVDIASIGSIDGVVDANLMAEGNGIQIVFDTDRTDAQQVLRALLDMELPIDSFRPDRRHLNQAFMDLTEAGLSS